MFNIIYIKQLNIKKIFILLICCTILMFSVIFSTVFIAENSVHNCHHENCDVCVQIATCIDLLRVTSAGIVAIIIYNLFPFTRENKLLYKHSYIHHDTLVSLKIKLLN